VLAKLAHVVETWDPDIEPDLPPRVAWLVERLWP